MASSCQNSTLLVCSQSATMATVQSCLFSLHNNKTLKPHHHKPTTILSCPNFFLPFKFPRLGICYSKRKLISCLAQHDANGSFGSLIQSSNPEPTVDLKLPRRSLLVQFTCNACGVRSERLINRLAYEKGMVFVQCVGCLQYHKLVDNLNLVVEYDFREKIDMSPDMDQF